MPAARKTAIVSVLLDCDAEQAAVALERARGHVRAAVSGHEKSNADAPIGARRELI